MALPLFSRSVMFAIGMLAVLPALSMPQAPVAESELKAAYLYNFAVFTSWPAEKASQEGPLVFCVIADDVQTTAITGLQNRKVRERSIQIRQIETPEEVAGCHVLYVGSKAADVMPRVLDAVRDNATLTVTDVLDVARKGAVISLALDNGRLAFDVNLQSARRARLVLSSKLLKLARSAN